MKYLFFDIECANCIPSFSKICSFGYVLTDENYNVLEQNDLLMNPKGPFALDIKKGKKAIELKYPEEVFRASKDFPYYYPKIRELLSQKDIYIVGHSVNNDVKYILDELLYYELENIDFDFYDTQLFYRWYASYEERISLNNACTLLGVGVQADAHDSLSDAILTKDLCKAMCQNRNITLTDLIRFVPETKGSFKDYVMTLSDRVTNYWSGNKILKQGFYKYLDCRRKIYKDLYNTSYIIDKKICISYHYEEGHYTEMVNLIQRMTDMGASYTTKAVEADYYVTYTKTDEEGNDIPCRRLLSVNKYNENHPGRIKIITMDDLRRMLNLTNDISVMDVDLLEFVMNSKSDYELSLEEKIAYMKSKKEEQIKLKKEESLGNRFQDFFSSYKK